MRHCKGLCTNVRKLYNQKPGIGFISDVGIDRKYCAMCGYWLVCSLINCPCCGCPMRTTPKCNRSKRNYKKKPKSIIIY